MPDQDYVTVQYYTCNCEWYTKYCDENHTKTVIVPREMIERAALNND